MARWWLTGPGSGTVEGDLGLLVLRLAAGIGLTTHGILKLPPPDRFVRIVRQLGFPMPEAFAWMAGLVEFFGAILLVLGLWTRPAASLIAFTMAVAFFGAHRADAFSQKEMSMLYGAAALAIAAIGPGRFALDRLVGGGGKSQRRR